MPPEQSFKPPKLIPSTRFTLALLISFALLSIYAQRVSLSMAIVCMVDRNNINTISSHTQVLNKTIKTINKYGSQFLKEKQFILTEFQQQILLAAHLFGYLLTLVPGGWLSMRIGAKRVFIFSILLSSTATLGMATIYFLDDIHLILAIILRFISGFGFGPALPAAFTFWTVWAVPLERSTLTSVGFCSMHLGTAITMLIGGLFCRYVSSGWVYIFVLTGIFGFIWLPLWLWFVSDSPQTNRSISEKERNYICEHMGIGTNDKKTKTPSLLSLPWKKIIRSKPIIALLIAQVCHMFGLSFFYSNVGKILTEIHHISPQYAGYVLGGGFILMPISSLSSGIIADRLVRAKKISLTNVRKLFNSLASYISAICMIILCFCDHTRQILGVIAVVVYLAGSSMANGAGYYVNFGDIAPAYSSVIFGLGGTLVVISAIGTNIVAGLVIKRPVLEDWRKMFIFFSIAYIIGGSVYILYGSAVPRKWATLKTGKSKQNEEDQDLTTVPQQTDIPSSEIKNTEIHLPE